MLVDKSLSRQQFEVVVNLVKTLLKKLLDIRTRDFGIAEIGVGEFVGAKNVGDPFSSAKAIINSTRHQNSVTNGHTAGTVSKRSSLTAGAGAPPPPPPSKPPPPLPTSGPPPVPPVVGLSVPPVLPPAPVSRAPSKPAEVLHEKNNGSSLYSNEMSSYRSEWQKTESFPPTQSFSGGSTEAAGPHSSLSAAPAALTPVPAASAGTANPSSLSPNQKKTEAESLSSKQQAGAASSKGSVLSWFSKSSSSSAASSSASGSVPAEYEPPVIPDSPVGKPTLTTSLSSFPSSSAAVIDEEDFLSSFKKTSLSNSSSSSSGASSIGSGFSAQSQAPNSLYYNAPPAAAAPTAAASKPGLSLSLEEQIRQTQEQIAKLSGQQAPANYSSASAPAAISTQSTGIMPSFSMNAGNNSSLSAFNTGTSASFQPQLQQQQQFPPQQQQQQQQQSFPQYGSAYGAPSPYLNQNSYQPHPQLQPHQPYQQQQQQYQQYQQQYPSPAPFGPTANVPPAGQYPQSQQLQPGIAPGAGSGAGAGAGAGAGSWYSSNNYQQKQMPPPDISSRIGNMPQPKPGSSLYQPPTVAPLSSLPPSLNYGNPQQQPQQQQMYMYPNPAGMTPQMQQQQQQQQRMGMKPNNNASTAFDFLN